MSHYPLRLAIHGGAGRLHQSVTKPIDEQKYHLSLKKALTQGYAVLKKQGRSIDAVCEAVRVLENAPLFNAGRGSVLTQKGKIEMDAAVMDGDTLKAGAVAGVSRLRNPVLAAHIIQQYSKHILLIGRHAEYFARRHGEQWIEPATLITARQLKRWQALKEKKIFEHKFFGTVGAVALDDQGNLASATSTGGIMNKAPGRVGDSPIIGAGTYADNNTCAVSATGQGEFFIKLSFAYDIAARMHYRNLTLEQAANAALERLNNLGAEGGFIALDRQGNCTMIFNTELMYRGYIDEHGLETKIK